MTTPFSERRGLDALIDHLRQDAIRDRLTPGLAQIPGGDWNALLRWAAAEGYALTLADLRDAFARFPGLEAKLAASPFLNRWNHASLKAAIASASTA